MQYHADLMRAHPLAILCALASCPAPTLTVPVQPGNATPSWSDLADEANASLAKKDYLRYQASLVELYRTSGSSSILLSLARADARVGDLDAALAHLSDYAAMGLDADVDASAALSRLKDDPRWPALRARLESNRAPVAHATTVFALPHEDLIPEGLAWDPRSRTFFVSSVRRRKIIAVDEQGTAHDFLSPADRGVGALCGLASDGKRLWVTMATLPQMVGFDAKGPRATALLAYDLATGSLGTRIDLPVDDGREHALTDLTVGPQGDVYVSDEPGRMVYALAPGATRLEPLVATGSFLSPQTPAISPDGHHLYVPDYVRGIAALDLASRRMTWIIPNAGVALDGIDDLHVVGGDLVAVQNGVTPPRIVRFTLDARGVRATRADVLERASPGFGDPTHGLVRDGKLWFIAAAGWGRFDDQGAATKDAPPDAPVIMALPLDGATYEEKVRRP